MKNYAHFFFALLLSLTINAGFSQAKHITSDSIFFKLDKYYALDENGDWMKYHSAGFYFPEDQSHPPGVSLLPNIALDIEKIRFLTDSNRITDKNDYQTVRKIEIPFLYSTIFPNDSQAIGIISQIKEKPLDQYISDASRTNGSLPNISPLYRNHPMISQLVNSFYSALDQQRHEQDDYLKIWSSYQVRTTSINELDIALFIDGKEIAKQIIYTNSKEGSYELQILNPSTQICQDLMEGKFKVLLDYRTSDPVVTKEKVADGTPKSIKIFIDGDKKGDFRADLGIIGAIYNPALFNLDQPGILLTGIAEKSPLLTAGISGGEVIFKINDRVITSSADIDAVLFHSQPGQYVTLTLIDLNRNTVVKKVTLAKAPFIH